LENACNLYLYNNNNNNGGANNRKKKEFVASDVEHPPAAGYVGSSATFNTQPVRPLLLKPPVIMGYPSSLLIAL
jgi:hypothetical protein